MQTGYERKGTEFSAGVQIIQRELHQRLGASSRPVERDIAMLLELPCKPGEAEAFRLQRYHRKIDVARKVMSAYDEHIQKPMGGETLAEEGYLGLALVFAKVSSFEDRYGQASKARVLGWLNSAFNSLDCVKAPAFDEPARIVRVELNSMLRMVCVL